MKNKQPIFAIGGIIILVAGAFIYFAINSSPFSDVEAPPVSPEDSSVIPSAGKVVEGVGYIKIVNSAFVPSEIRIKAGQAVFWTNEDSVAHSVRSDQGTEISSSSFDKGFSYVHQFAAPGTYSYHCAQHPEMKARVIVE